MGEGLGSSGCVAGPGAAALVIAITNDGDTNGPPYLLGCALVAVVSLGLWFGRSQPAAAM